MNWDDIRYFLALARHGSLSATARAMAIETAYYCRAASDSAGKSLGSKIISSLSAWVDIDNRGETLYQQAYSLEEKIQALKHTALEQSSLQGRVRLSAPPLLLNYFLVPHLQSFISQYPQITLELSGDIHNARLGQGEADIAIRLHEPTESTLVARRLAQIDYGLYATAAYCQLLPTQQQFIDLNTSLSALKQKVWLDQYRGERPIVMTCNDFMTVYQAAKQGLGIALLPYFLAKTEPQLHLLDETLTIPKAGVYLVMHADVRRAPRVRHTANHIITVFEQHASKELERH